MAEPVPASPASPASPADRGNRKARCALRSLFFCFWSAISICSHDVIAAVHQQLDLLRLCLDAVHAFHRIRRNKITFFSHPHCTTKSQVGAHEVDSQGVSVARKPTKCCPCLSFTVLACGPFVGTPLKCYLQPSLMVQGGISQGGISQGGISQGGVSQGGISGYSEDIKYQHPPPPPLGEPPFQGLSLRESM